MVVERRNFQRVYDLTPRVMLHWDDERDGLSQSQAENLMLDNSARSLGIFREQWLADYYRLKRPDLKGWRESRAEQQQIIPVEVETLGRMWLHADLLSQLEPALNNVLKATHSAVLSPFDPVVWDRKRAAQLFGFNYRLECYTPAAKHQYGYFVLPLLNVRGFPFLIWNSYFPVYVKTVWFPAYAGRAAVICWVKMLAALRSAK